MTYAWLIFAVLCALSEAAKDLLSKRGLKDCDEFVVAWAFAVYAVPFILLAIPFVEIPDVGLNFWLFLVGNGCLYGFTVVLYMRAIKLSDLSITVPMVAFTPLVMLLTTPLLIGELPSKLGVVGTLLIVAGSYVLNIKEVSQGYLKPFHALLRESGPRIMLVIAVLWSLTSNFDKLGIGYSSALFWMLCTHGVVTLFLTFFALARSPDAINALVKYRKTLFPIGFANASMIYTYFGAMTPGYPVYVLSIKRCSILVVIVMSYFIFKESGIRQRFAGGLVMLAGVFCIAFG